MERIANWLSWSAAYKQVRVLEEDRILQYFEWLGRYFLELCLLFGWSSSVRNYDRFAKVVFFIALQLAGMPASLVVKKIDGVVACGPPDGKLVEKFDKAYIEVADKLGVVLASRDDPEKRFRINKNWYDSESWN